MKKWIIAFVVIGGLVVGGYGIATFRLKNAWLDGVKEPAKRGDMVIPVTASGTIEPEQYIQIKSKAGGQVMKIHVVPGQRVKSGDVLVELDPVDETRNVESRQADVDRAASAVEKARTNFENNELDLPLQTSDSEARLADAAAQFAEAEFRWKKILAYSKDIVGDVEKVSTEQAFNRASAATKLAENAVARAKNNQRILLKAAREDLTSAEATLSQTKKSLDEAEQRLKETIIRAPADGMVYRVDVKQGEMIQSGTQSFTGGTPVITLADSSAMFVMAQVDEADIGMIRDISPDFAKPGLTRELTPDEIAAYTQHVLSAQDESQAQKEVLQAAALRNVMKGKPVEVTVDAYRNEAFSGVIERILPEPQNLSNVITFRVRIRLVGPDLEKLLGLQADLSFTTKSLENVVLVKNDALFSEGKQCFVYIPKRKSERSPWDEEKRLVRIGSTDGTFTEVIEGLNDGEEVWIVRPKQTEREKESKS